MSEADDPRLPARPSYLGLLLVLPLFALLWLVYPWLPGDLAQAAALLAASVACYAFYVHRHEHRPVRELRGVDDGLRETLIGALIALGIVALDLALYIVSGHLTVGGWSHWSTFSATLFSVALYALAFPVFEELVFRGIVLRYFELWLGSWAALVLSALLFAAYHEPQSLASTFDRFAMGLLLGAAYLLTRRLWMSIGFHCAVNLGVFLVWGWDDIKPALSIVYLREPGWLLAGVRLQVVVSAMVALLLILLLKRRGAFVGGREAWRCQVSGNPPTRQQNDADLRIVDTG